MKIEKFGYFMAALLSIVLILCMASVVRAETVEIGIAPGGVYVDNPYQTIEMTDAEAQELRWVVALEAQGEGFEGECAVVEAIFNRVLSQHNWGGSIHGVLSMKGQFSTYKYIGSTKAWATPGEMEDDAIADVIRRGPSRLPSMKYVYFDSRGGVNGRNKIKLGHHWFAAEK